MQLIGFNEHYRLQTAVFEGWKTMTRRIEKGLENLEEGNFCFQKERNQVVLYGEKGTPIEIAANEMSVSGMKCEQGWDNKMFVKAYLMPHHIRITDIKVERLQDISDEDCLKEGILKWKDMKDCPTNASEFERNLYGYYGSWDSAVTPRTAFEYMIDRINSKGTWDRNPFVVVYTFELID